MFEDGDNEASYAIPASMLFLLRQNEGNFPRFGLVVIVKAILGKTVFFLLVLLVARATVLDYVFFSPLDLALH